jgi:hypothetical protein
MQNSNQGGVNGVDMAQYLLGTGSPPLFIRLGFGQWGDPGNIGKVPGPRGTLRLGLAMSQRLPSIHWQKR